MILQMVEGAMTFTVNNGRGPIVAVFQPDFQYRLCDGQWHEIHAVKAKVRMRIEKRPLGFAVVMLELANALWISFLKLLHVLDQARSSSWNFLNSAVRIALTCLQIKPCRTS